MVTIRIITGKKSKAKREALAYKKKHLSSFTSFYSKLGVEKKPSSDLAKTTLKYLPKRKQTGSALRKAYAGSRSFYWNEKETSK